MKQLFVALGAVTALVACGGVDRDGTRDNIVNGLKDRGMDIDADCVDDALDDYSDDQLEAIDKTLDDDQSSTESDQLLQKILACVPTGT
jgi:hypothetical protein